ncbi:hypothetical protein A3J23_02100 [Candidatus Peregrinibacteria bacterium RIFCSPLOWO2_02_FULL_48_14]|nr:MAG: hypothetical protein A2974_03185 [Candidatus Peregrinibacteria bacterium RIFCSPLOWO2_01_FULL_48_20]OGJ44611.1 MAG: hypothetical protein A3J23_02100 [Candidatus Peregrinibacteria bacterium RIFCSPLOWO2_02_FULL_48_14]
MIKSFKCKETEKIYYREGSKKFANIQKIALRKLMMIKAATDLNDLKVPPGNCLEKLKWKNKDAHNVEIVDYH